MSDHLVLTRSWAEPARVDAAWGTALELTKYPLSVRWADDAAFPCDEVGFRIPPNFASVREKYAASARLARFGAGGGFRIGEGSGGFEGGGGAGGGLLEKPI